MSNIIKDHMARMLTSVCEDDFLKDVIELMSKTEMSVFPVVNSENKFMGTIYSNNILKDITSNQYGIEQVAENLKVIKERRVKEYMSTNIAVVRELDEMHNVADVMLDNQESYLFVINREEKLRGYLSRADLLYYLLEISE